MYFSPGTAPSRSRFAGLDIGKSTLKLVVLGESEHGVELLDSAQVPHEGRPWERLDVLYREHAIFECPTLGATGVHGAELGKPVFAGLPEDACIEAALSLFSELQGPQNLVRVGARGYSVLTRDHQGRVRFAENEKCSAGTGETIVRNAARFGLDVERADALALTASHSIPITARCSVFAKSELTHYGNQGQPHDALFRGYFESIARHVAALLSRIRVDGPVQLIGGGSRLATLRACLSQELGVTVAVPTHACALEAAGAALIAMRSGAREALPTSLSRLVSVTPVEFRVHTPARTHADRVTWLAPSHDSRSESTLVEPCVLGLDLGSTGSKAVFTGLRSGHMLLDAYDRTSGSPVEAAQRLVATLVGLGKFDVRGIAVTGSGREAVATVLRAAYPERDAEICVENEIVAHATAAIHCDDAHGESLSVVEIGGQDAKFIQIVGGHITESSMNKACSAGTGSFLEEQSMLYGVPEIERFGQMAEAASRPPDLGQMCTVFVAEAASDALGAGFSLPDVFAGFQYSVIANYKNRVMGQRNFGQRIFFQGKPASSRSLAWTLSAVTGKDVVVPHNPGAMGAYGVGLCARESLGSTLFEASPMDLSRLLSANVVNRSELRCKDKDCATLCRIERTCVEVAGQQRQVYSGGACPKFEISTTTRQKLDVGAPSAVDERDALLRSLLVPRPGAARVCVANTSTLAGYLPWALSFLQELGLDVEVLWPDVRALERGEDLSDAYDACAPVKVAHALAEKASHPLFMPKLVALATGSPIANKTCANEQAVSDLVAAALCARGKSLRVVAPVLDASRDHPDHTECEELRQAAVALGADPKRALFALRAANAAQARYEERLHEIGKRTLDYARTHGIPVVLLCGALHAISDPAVHATIPTILRNQGVLVLPMDCFAVPDHIDRIERVAWADLNLALRASLAARECGDVFPLLLSSFGCGPASFGEHLFERLMRGYPHTSLETDGHGGTAGYVTRVLAFLHGVRRYRGGPSPAPKQWLWVMAKAEKPGPQDKHRKRLVVFPMGDMLAEISAATYRSLGFDAVAAGPTSAAGLALGKSECSGKECLPYQLIWGAFREKLEGLPTDKPTALVQVTGQGACRNCMFSVKDRISLEQLGLSDRVELRHFGAQSAGGGVFFGKLWVSVVVWDILRQLAAYYRPLQREPHAVDDIYRRHCRTLIEISERKARGLLAGLLHMRETRTAYLALLDAASRDFAALAAFAIAKGSRPTVLLTGDIYVRIDDHASDQLVRKLNDRGMHVVLDPLSTLIEFLAEERSAELIGLPTDTLQNAVTKAVMARTRRKLYEHVISSHPWLPMPDVVGALDAGAKVLGRRPHSEAPITIGTYVQAEHSKVCDAIVVAAPWGCSPALISEALLRHRTALPTLFVYSDGAPLDDRKLNAFAYRLCAASDVRGATA